VTGARPRARRARAPAAAAAIAVLALLAGASTGPAGAFDPGALALSPGYPTANATAASMFRLALEENLTACAWPDCDVTRSDDVQVTVAGPDRIGGATVATYDIQVSGVDRFEQNYTTIAVVLKTESTNIIMNVGDTAELAGNVAYTKLLNGSSTMRVSLIGPNATGNLSLYVFGYVGDGNQTTHGQGELYNLEVVPVETRATRSVPLNVTVSNTQNVSLTGVPVAFYVKGPSDTEYAHVGNATIPTIVANGEAFATVDWDATWADPAVYTVKAIIDPEHRFPETREDNNVRFFQVDLGDEGPPPGPAWPEVFGWGVVAVFLAVVGAVWWYNRRYE